jgi:hypothetical protein
MYSTAKPTCEWTGSIRHVPVGSCVSVAVIVLKVSSLATAIVDYANNSSKNKLPGQVLTDQASGEPVLQRLERASCSHVGSVRAPFEESYSAEELETFAALLSRLPV